MLSAAKPLPKQQVNKGKVWLIFVLGAASLFGTAVVMENNRTFFPAISRANRAMAVTRRQEEVCNCGGCLVVCRAHVCTLVYACVCILGTHVEKNSMRTTIAIPHISQLSKQKQEAVDDAYLRSLEAGAGVPPLPAQLSDPSYFPSSGNPTSTTTSAAVGVDTVDEETARLTAAVQAGLAQASQRVASSSSNAGSSAEGAAADIQRVQAESIPTPGPAEYPAQLQAEDATPTQDAAAPSPSSPLYTPNGATVSTSAITPSQDPSSGYVVVTEQDPAALAGATVLQQVQSIATAGVQQSRVAVKQLQKGLEAAKARGDQSSSSQ